VADNIWSSADLSKAAILADQLLRRVPSLTHEDFVTTNTETGERSLTSACFKLRSKEDGLSVYSRTVIERNGLDCAKVCSTPFNVVVGIPGALPDSQGLETVPDPWPTDVPEPDHLRNAAHMLIDGLGPLSKSERNELARTWARTAEWVYVPGVSI
jgi:hypothetical protein